MALWDDLLEEMIVWTKREDLVDKMGASAIRGTVLKAHRREKFFKDLKNVTVSNPDPTQGVMVVDIAAAFPRWRQFHRVAQFGSASAFDSITASDLLDEGGYLRYNVWLVAGTELNVKAIAGFPTLDVWYYQDPVATEAGFDSWIAREYPDLIAAGASARILAGDNESEIFKAAKMEEAEQWTTLVRSNIEAEGR